VFPVKYKLGIYIPEDDILHSNRREYIKSYIQEDAFRNSWDAFSDSVTHPLVFHVSKQLQH
jgi:hypothetical protein